YDTGTYIYYKRVYDDIFNKSIHQITCVPDGGAPPSFYGSGLAYWGITSASNEFEQFEFCGYLDTSCNAKPIELFEDCEDLTYTKGFGETEWCSLSDHGSPEGEYGFVTYCLPGNTIDCPRFIPTGISNINLSVQVTVFPNPADKF